MGLSERVWNYTGQFKEEIEMALDLGIRSGKSAAEMSRDERQYLRYPDKLFRRVRDEHGNLRLSKAAKAFHPGQGVYRSSYKNALRIAATETNMAYRTADYLRGQQLDFVVGIQVKLSNNHTLNGRPFVDICDELAGVYPKDFKFVGWHPSCRCYSVKVLKTMDEFLADERKLLNGEALTAESANTVRDMPPQFRQWVLDNRERIGKARAKGTESYFIRDNKAYVNKILDPKPNALKIAQKRHSERTEAQIRDIRRRWTLRNAEMRHKARTVLEVEGIKLRAWNRQLRAFNPNLAQDEREAIAKNWLEIERGLGIKKGRMMTIEEADKQSANPNYGKGYEYSINCQTCAPAYMLRQWGFNVTAKGNTPGSVSEYLSKQRSFEAWTNIDGSAANPVYQRDWLTSKRYKKMTAKRWREYFTENCKDEGTYLLTIGWKGGGGHATILQKTSEGLFYIEPQAYNAAIGAKRSIDELCLNGGQNPIKKRGLLRIDNKLFEIHLLSIFEK